MFTAVWATSLRAGHLATSSAPWALGADQVGEGAQIYIGNLEQDLEADGIR